MNWKLLKRLKSILLASVVDEENEEQLQPLSLFCSSGMMNHKNKKKWAILSAIILLFLLIFEVAITFTVRLRVLLKASTKAADSGLQAISQSMNNLMPTTRFIPMKQNSS